MACQTPRTWMDDYRIFAINVLIRPMAALRSRCGHYIFIMWFLLSFFFLLLSFFSPILSRRTFDVYTILPHMVWPYCEFRMHCRCETCCTQLAEIQDGRKILQQFAIWAPSHNFVWLYLSN